VNFKQQFLALVEKAGWTYVQSFLAVLTIGSGWHIAVTTQLAVAALPAALTVLANGLPLLAPVGLPYMVDLGYRIVKTAAAAFLGVLLAQPVFHLTASVGRSALCAAGAAVLVIVKGVVAKQLGQPTPATLPLSVDVPPTQAAPTPVGTATAPTVAPVAAPVVAIQPGQAPVVPPPTV
jgi:hypothetical protein